MFHRYKLDIEFSWISSGWMANQRSKVILEFLQKYTTVYSMAWILNFLLTTKKVRSYFDQFVLNNWNLHWISLILYPLKEIAYFYSINSILHKCQQKRVLKSVDFVKLWISFLFPKKFRIEKCSMIQFRAIKQINC